jgi:hypothetical protein
MLTSQDYRSSQSKWTCKKPQIRAAYTNASRVTLTFMRKKAIMMWYEVDHYDTLPALITSNVLHDCINQSRFSLLACKLPKTKLNADQLDSKDHQSYLQSSECSQHHIPFILKIKNKKATYLSWNRIQILPWTRTINSTDPVIM